jgi:hypothetical protein
MSFRTETVPLMTRLALNLYSQERVLGTVVQAESQSPGRAKEIG